MKYDPLLFNIFIMVIYVLNAANWIIAGVYPQALYWFAAFLITFAVTWQIILAR